MVIGMMGDSCAGKSTIAKILGNQLDAEVVSGKDYLRLAKSEQIAGALFRKKLRSAMTEGNIIYVISEKDQLPFLPENAIRILVTASLDTIKVRFAQRMNGNLPEPVARMLEKKYGLFEQEAYHLRIASDETNAQEACEKILKLLKQ